MADNNNNDETTAAATTTTTAAAAATTTKPKPTSTHKRKLPMNKKRFGKSIRRGGDRKSNKKESNTYTTFSEAVNNRGGTGKAFYAKKLLKSER
jgi:hypothetical protein